MGHPLLLSLLILLGGGVCRSAGLLQKYSLESTQNVFVLLMYDVGLAPGAELTLNVSNAAPSNSTVLVILSSGQWELWRNQPRMAKLKGGGYSSYLVSHWRYPFYERLFIKHRIRAPTQDRYYVGILNVDQVMMQLESECTYVNPGGQHLPLDMIFVPEAVSASSAAFAILTLIVIVLLAAIWPHSTTKLHALFLGCVFLKSGELFLKWKYYEVLSHLGEAPIWRYQVWQLSRKLHATFEILLLLMASLGWKVLKVHLSRTEFRFVSFMVSSATILAFFQAIVVDWAPPKSLDLFFYLLRVFCYICIIFALNFNSQLISVHLKESPVSERVALLYQKQQTFVHFRQIFFAIVFQPSLVMWIQVSTFRQEMWWTASVIDDASTWAIYACLFAVLRPPPGRHGFVELVRHLTAGGVDGESSDGDDTNISLHTGSSDTDDFAPTPAGGIGL